MDDVFRLEREAERLVQMLFEGIGLGRPDFVDRREMLMDRATLFWETYFAGMRTMDG